LKFFIKKPEKLFIIRYISKNGSERVIAKNIIAKFIIFFGRPPVYIMPRKIGTKTDADEKSGSSKIRTIQTDAEIKAEKILDIFFFFNFSSGLFTLFFPHLSFQILRLYEYSKTDCY